MRAALVSGVLAAAGTGCSDEADATFDSAFCREVRERSDQLVASGASDVPATLVGALRELVEDADAPDELRDGLNELTEASSAEDLDEALAQIDQTLAGCGVDMEG